MRVAMLGAGSMPAPDEAVLKDAQQLFEALSSLGFNEFTFGGSGAANFFCQQIVLNAAASCKVFAALLWKSVQDAEDRGCFIDHRVFAKYLNCAESGNFGARDIETMSECSAVVVLPWGIPGLGTMRELAAAGKFPWIKHIVFVEGSRMSNEQLHAFGVLEQALTTLNTKKLLLLFGAASKNSA